MTLRNQLFNFLINIYGINSSSRREALLSYLGFSYLTPQIDIEGAPMDFCNSLLGVLAQQGRSELLKFIAELKSSPFAGGLESQQELVNLHSAITALSNDEFKREFGISFSATATSGDNINAQGVQGFINRPTGPITLNFHEAPKQTWNNNTTKIEGDMQMGDKIEIKDSKLQNVNIKSKLKDVTMTIGAMPALDKSAKDELTTLVEQFQAELEKLPEGKAKDAEKIISRLEDLMKEANSDEPEKEEIETRGESLKKAAKNVADVLPTVLSIAGQIASRLSSSF